MSVCTVALWWTGNLSRVHLASRPMTGGIGSSNSSPAKDKDMDGWWRHILKLNGTSFNINKHLSQKWHWTMNTRWCFLVICQNICWQNKWKCKKKKSLYLAKMLLSGWLCIYNKSPICKKVDFGASVLTRQTLTLCDDLWPDQQS